MCEDCSKCCCKCGRWAQSHSSDIRYFNIPSENTSMKPSRMGIPKQNQPSPPDAVPDYGIKPTKEDNESYSSTDVVALMAIASAVTWVMVHTFTVGM